MTLYQNRLNRYIYRIAQDMKIRNMAKPTIDAYTWHVSKFCDFFNSPPEQLGPEETGVFGGGRIDDCIFDVA